jgi:hypothetical protein
MRIALSRRFAQAVADPRQDQRWKPSCRRDPGGTSNHSTTTAGSRGTARTRAAIKVLARERQSLIWALEPAHTNARHILVSPAHLRLGGARSGHYWTLLASGR